MKKIIIVIVTVFSAIFFAIGLKAASIVVRNASCPVQTVFINEVMVGTVKMGQSKSFSVRKGQNSVRSHDPRYGNGVKTFNVCGNKVNEFVVRCTSR